MKSIEEIQIMLVDQLWEGYEKIQDNRLQLKYYNEILGDTSFLLAGLLEALLRKNFDDWDPQKWIDDCLLSNVEIKNQKMFIWGIMIWGMEDTTQQWTEPFYFEIELLKEKKDFKNYNILYGDVDNMEITYEEFINNTDYWKPRNRNWKFRINSNKTNI